MSLNDLLKIERRARKSGDLQTTNHIPRGGSGYGLQNGKRVVYRNGRIVPASSAVVQDLLIENPKGVVKGLYKYSGLKSIVEEPGSLGIIDPRLWMAMGRTKNQMAAVGRKEGEVNPQNPNLIWDLKSGDWIQNKAVTNQIAKTEKDKLRLRYNPDKFFGVCNFGDAVTRNKNINADIPENPNLFKGQTLISQGGGSTAILQPGDAGSNLNKDVISNQSNTSESIVGNENSNTLRINNAANSAEPKTPIVQEKETRQALKSDVFTLGKDGKPLGVMTRAQRRKWDADNQTTMQENIDRLKIQNRSYSSGNTESFHTETRSG